MSAVDLFTVEVIRHALTAAAEEMSLVVQRSARSPLLREAADLSSALTDHAGELVAQGQDMPIHLGVMSLTVKEFLKRVPVDRMRPGDTWFLNLPEVGGNHLPDVKAIRPVFAEGRLLAFAVSLAHWADIGGAAPGSYFAAARDIWSEGLRIPPTRVIVDDQPDREKLDFIMANVRGPVEREGDLLAQVAATRVAERRLHEIIAQHGAATLAAAMATLHDRSEAQMREAIAKLPDGIYEGEDFLDDGGPENQPVAVRVRVEIRGEEASFDFSKTDDAMQGPLNTTRFVADAAVFYAIRALAAPDIQPNGGAYRPLKITTRPGSLLDPDGPFPVVGGNHETSQRVVDAIIKALAAAIPERVSAGGPTTSGVMIFGCRASDGRWSILYEVHGGGEGATATKDGASAVRVHMSNVMNTPSEVVEVEYPFRIEEHALRPGSAGDGTHRGGLGLRRAYRVLAPEVTLTTMLDRRVVPPYGIAGGGEAAPFRITLNPGPGAREIRGKETVMLRQGDLVLIETCGGGGFGPPAARPAEARERDRREGYV